MPETPNIEAGDWIIVEKQDCVVMRVYPKDSKNGCCLVVFNKKKPTTRDVDWDGEKWFFPDRPDFGGYGRDSDPFVQKLRRGR
jgi:hypothetical protein